MLYNVIKYYKMPKTVIDYQNTVIYKIVCKDLNIKDLYVGSTTNFTQRKRCHKDSCNFSHQRNYNFYVYQFIRENGGWNNWDMIEVEKYKCNDRNEKDKRERYWIEELKATLNKVIPSRTKKELYEKNKEEILVKRKEYYEENKEEILEKNKEYYEVNKEEINDKRRKHYEENKKEILGKNKEWREKNKEKINEKNKEKVKCSCGDIITKCNLTRHKKSIKHQEYEQKSK